MPRKRTNPSCPVCGKRTIVARRVKGSGRTREVDFYYRCSDKNCYGRVY